MRLICIFVDYRLNLTNLSKIAMVLMKFHRAKSRDNDSFILTRIGNLFVEISSILTFQIHTFKIHLTGTKKCFIKQDYYF